MVDNLVNLQNLSTLLLKKGNEVRVDAETMSITWLSPYSYYQAASQEELQGYIDYLTDMGIDNYEVETIDQSNREWIEGLKFTSVEDAYLWYNAGEDMYLANRDEIPLDNASLTAFVRELNAISSITFVALAEQGMLDTAAVAERANFFPEWTAGFAYKEKAIVRDDGLLLYQAKQSISVENANHPPWESPELWVHLARKLEEGK